MSDNPPIEDIRVLLQSVEIDTARTSANRNQIRRSALAAFDEASVARTDVEPDVIRLVALDDEPRRFVLSPRAMGLFAAAAAVLLVILALSSSRSGSDSSGLATQGVSEERRLSVDGQELPALLLPGRQITDSIAGGLSFDSPDGLVVVDEGDGLLVLAVADEPGEGTGNLIIVETELSDWVAELDELAEAGEVNLKSIGVIVAGRATTRWDVAITNEAIEDRSCTIGEPCIRLTGWPTTGPAALRAGADNRIVEIGRTEDSLVLAIEASQRFTGPLSLLGAQVVNTATLVED